MQADLCRYILSIHLALFLQKIDCSFTCRYKLHVCNSNLLLQFFYSLTISQTSPDFYVSAVKVFSKTLWEKKKLLVTSNFSFSHSVCYPFGELSAIFIKFEIAVCKLFQFGRVENLSFAKGLNTLLKTLRP